MRRATNPGSLYRLIYRSREVIAQVVPDAVTEAGLQRELRAIVCAARARNRADNVTGALLFNDAGFAQVLEGPREVVERTFERVAADPRQAEVRVLSFTPTQRRSFPDWPMAFCGQSLLGYVVPSVFPLAVVPSAGVPLGGVPLGGVPLGHFADGGAPGGARVTIGSDVLRLLERVVQQEDVWIGA